MYKHEKWLRVTSILLIIYGGTYCLGLLLYIFTSAVYLKPGLGLLLLGIVLYVAEATLNLGAGITGLRMIKRKGSEKLLTVFAYSLLAISLLDLIVGVVSPPLKIKDITQPVIHILIIALYLKNGRGLQFDRTIRDVQSETDK